MSQQIPERSERRLIENEQIIQAQNEVSKNAVKKYFGTGKELQAEPLRFYCECSNMACQEIIVMAIGEYERTHRRNDRFVVVSGHDTPEVEKVVSNTRDYDIVEKFKVAP